MSEPSTRRVVDPLNAVPLQDRERGVRNLARIRSRVPDAVVEAIPSLIVDLPDPDSALNLFERLIEQSSDEVIRLFEGHRSVLHYALMIGGYSQYLGETLIHNVDLLPTLLEMETLDRSRSREDFRGVFARFRSRFATKDIAAELARFRRREYVRIMLRDVLGLATLADLTSEISALSDVLIEEALAESEAVLEARYGRLRYQDKRGKLAGVPFAVLALGKLGGNELNYSSDVDLMFVYGREDGSSSARITNREFFVRLAQQVTDVLSRITSEGFVFRIDLRLRPQGKEGESAVSIEESLRYYRDKAEDWERQALIKVRHCAGDAELAKQFIREVQDSVYTEDVNFAAIETALRSRDRIQDRRRKAMTRNEAIDLKLDSGGIRDIEFLVQCLQRVYGGKERWLRSSGTLFSLQKLHDKQHITGNDFHRLTNAYQFLRTLEHRLQLRNGQQTHRLPVDSNNLAILARSLHDEDVSPENLSEIVRMRMQGVAEIYQRIVHHQQQQTEDQAREEFELRTLDLSFGRVQSDRQIIQRLAADNEALHAIASRTDLDPHTRRNLFRFLSSAFTSPERYASVAAATGLVERSLELFRTSELLTDILVRHPDAINSLADLRQSSPRHQSEGLFGPVETDGVPLGHKLKRYVSSDAFSYPDKLALLRQQFRQRIFLSGARDVLEARPVFASLADTTFAAEEAIAAAFSMCHARGLAAVALGRLGSHEFDCLSDADLIFVRDPGVPPEEALRSVESIMHALSAYTQEGTVITADVQLRPHGSDGPLTTTPEQLASYFEKEAQAWEAVAYTKLRFIAGDEEVAAKAVGVKSVLYSRFIESGSFRAELREMRSKLENSDGSQNFKTGAGGLYDLDFITGYLLVREGIAIADGNARQRLQRLGQARIGDSEDLQVLLDAIDLFRTVEHVIRLVTGRTQHSLPVSENARRNVEELVGRLSSRDFAGDLETRMTTTRVHVRKVFDRILSQ